MFVSRSRVSQDLIFESWHVCQHQETMLSDDGLITPTWMKTLTFGSDILFSCRSFSLEMLALRKIIIMCLLSTTVVVDHIPMTSTFDVLLLQASTVQA